MLSTECKYRQDKTLTVIISNLGLYLAFKHDLQEAFSPYNAPGNALEKMKILWIKGEDLINDHVTKFKMLVTSSGLGSNSATIIDLYQKSLPLGLQK